ncbi:hypothetical protein B0H13DRAFT_1892832 [Mycena leptocephala]|nr:hypothetical protein B0H13DRAFT_1892832 [Mycena leptocephala]
MSWFVAVLRVFSLTQVCFWCGPGLHRRGDRPGMGALYPCLSPVSPHATSENKTKYTPMEAPSKERTMRYRNILHKSSNSNRYFMGARSRRCCGERRCRNGRGGGNQGRGLGPPDINSSLTVKKLSFGWGRPLEKIKAAT